MESGLPTLHRKPCVRVRKANSLSRLLPPNSYLELKTTHTCVSGTTHPFLSFWDRSSKRPLLISVTFNSSIPHNRVLRIVVQRGFESEFLDYFDTVSCDDGCACGKSMNQRSRMVVADVATDALFSNDSREVLLRANVRSVQSTPLIDSSGNLVGMVSTHNTRPGSLMRYMWKPIDGLAAKFLADISVLGK